MENSKLETRLKDLEKQVKFYENILDKLPATIYIQNCKDFNIQWATYGNMLHYSKEDYTKMGACFLKEKLHPDDLTIAKESFEYLKENKGPLCGIYRIKDKDDSWRWLYCVSVVLSRTKKGIPDYILGIAEDISHKIYTEKQLEQLFKVYYLKKNKDIIECLTKKEKELLKLFAKGIRCKDIAQNLSLSFYTIDTHRKNLMRKLGIHNISELAAFAVENGLN
jgi:DNA-binding CsgD family transcriptional regulator